jgi:hypothetical protein
MEILSLLDLVFVASRADNEAIHKNWIAYSHSMRVGDSSEEFCHEIQRLGELDVLLRKIESELSVGLLENRFEKLPIGSVNIGMLLSYSWLSAAYELFRSAKQRGTESYSSSEGFQTFFRQLELARVQSFKGEIAGFGSAKKTGLSVELVTFGDINEPPRAYEHGRTKARPFHQIRTYDGSIGWTVFDVKSEAQITVYRRDMSDGILSFLSEHM